MSTVYLSHMQNFTYLDTAATGILSEDTLTAGRKYDELLITAPSKAFYSFLEDDYALLKNNFARFIGVAEDRLSLAPNFSYAFAILLSSLRPHKSKVLVYETDYPSLRLPIQLQGFDVTVLESEDGFSWSTLAIEQTIIENSIEILAISHVQYNSGFQSDLEMLSAICKAHDVLLIVDATQSLGGVNFHFDHSKVDVLIASNYKWMNGGFGSAVMCFREGFIDEFAPTIAGYGSLTIENGAMVYKPSASSYFPGHMSLNSLLTLDQAVKEKLEFNMHELEMNNLIKTTMTIRALKDSPVELVGPYAMPNRSAIFVIKADNRLHNHLLEHGIRGTYRNGTIRLSYHFTNKKEDVKTLLDCIQKYS